MDSRRTVRRDWAQESSGYCGPRKSSRVCLSDFVVVVALVEVVERVVERSPHWRQASRLWVRYCGDVGSTLTGLMTISLSAIVATTRRSACGSIQHT